MGIEPWLLFLLCSIIGLSVLISLAAVITLIKSVRQHYSPTCFRFFVFFLCAFLFIMVYILCHRIAQFIPEEMLNKVILFIFVVVTASSYIVIVNVGDDENDGFERWSMTKARLRHLIPIEGYRNRSTMTINGCRYGDGDAEAGENEEECGLLGNQDDDCIHPSCDDEDDDDVDPLICVDPPPPRYDEVMMGCPPLYKDVAIEQQALNSYGDVLVDTK